MAQHHQVDDGNEARGGLIISREKHQSIEIDGGITITVIKGSCQLKIQAPPDVAVVRTELLDRFIPLKLPRFSKLKGRRTREAAKFQDLGQVLSHSTDPAA